MFPKALLVFVIALHTLAASTSSSCTLSSATLYTATSSTGGESQDIVDAAFEKCFTACGSTPSASCSLKCLDAACTSHCGSSTSTCHSGCLASPCPAFYGSGSATPDPTALQACLSAAQGRPAGTIIKRKRLVLEKRDLVCSSSESCYKESNGILFCLNKSTGNYHDVDGGTGNVNTGAYTSSASARTSSTAVSKTSMPTISGSSAAVTTYGAGQIIAAGTSAASGTTSTSALSSVKAEVATAASTSATRNAAVVALRADGLVGVVGAVAGLAALY